MDQSVDWQNGGGQFETLLEHKTTIFHICLGYCRETQDAEDLTQEVFVRAYTGLSSLKHTDLKKEWLCRIARNVCLNFLKRVRRNPVTSSLQSTAALVAGNPESEAEEHQVLLLLKEAISQLPRKLHEVFVLKEYGELSYREISQSLGIKEGTVMSRLHRARQNVLKNMRERFDERKSRSE